MTTNASTIKFALSKFDCRGVSHEKQRCGTIFLSAPGTPPSKNANFIFIVVSPSLRFAGDSTRAIRDSNRPRFETSKIAVEDAVENRGLYNVFVSRLFLKDLYTL